MTTRLLATLFALIMTGTTALAENMAVVNVRALMAQAPQNELIKNTLQSEFGERTESLKKLEDEIKKLQSDLQTNEMTYSEQQKTEKARQIQAKGSDYQLQGKALQEDIENRSKEEQGKLLFLIRKAIQKVADEGNYDMILSSDAVLYRKPGVDITEKVLTVISDPTFK